MANKFLYTVALAAFFSMSFYAVINAQNKPVPNVCLGCICEAISGCNLTRTCVSGVCGLFRITQPYWVDGGRLTINSDSPNSDLAYPNCANDPYCAADTIQGYMTKYAQDCNGDGRIDCYDYAAIHKLGGFGCNGELSFKYQNTLHECLQQHSNIIDVRSN